MLEFLETIVDLNYPIPEEGVYQHGYSKAIPGANEHLSSFPPPRLTTLSSSLPGLLPVQVDPKLNG